MRISALRAHDYRVGFYRRNLPHWHPEDKALFITWRLHSSLTDEHLLRRVELAHIVVDALSYGEMKLRHYELHAWVLMSNHVHILITPLVPVAILMKSLKGITAKRSNALLGRTGRPFWQHESFDHWIRSGVEFGETVAYIEANPVRARLVQAAEDYRWSSAWPRAAASAEELSDQGAGATGVSKLSQALASSSGPLAGEENCL